MHVKLVCGQLQRYDGATCRACTDVMVAGLLMFPTCGQLPADTEAGDVKSDTQTRPQGGTAKVGEPDAQYSRHVIGMLTVSALRKSAASEFV
jgi:hypothetical protein